MPTLTITVPNAQVPEIVAAATAASYPRAQGDTDAAFVQTVLLAMLRSLVRTNRRTTRIVAAQVPNEDVGF